LVSPRRPVALFLSLGVYDVCGCPGRESLIFQTLLECSQVADELTELIAQTRALTFYIYEVSERHDHFAAVGKNGMRGGVLPGIHPDGHSCS
jgi:hypothetical protein